MGDIDRRELVIGTAAVAAVAVVPGLAAPAAEVVDVVEVPAAVRSVAIVGAPTDLLGYDCSDIEAAIVQMIDDVKTGRTAEAVEEELAAVRRTFGM